MFARFFTLLFLIQLSSHADDKILVSWHDFSDGFQLYRTSGSAKASDSSFQGVTGTIYGGHGSRDTWGSNDGTYGPDLSVGSTAADGVMSLRISGNNLDFTIRNGGRRNILLTEIVFDFASVSTNSPQNFELFYLSGGLSDANNTLLRSFPNSQNGLNLISNYEDVSVPLTGLTDRTLAPGQTARFRLVANTANNSFQAMAFDNIAILGDYSDFAALTYNIHGGFGPDDEGDVRSNMVRFRDDFMHDEDVLCLQEVDFDNGEWDIIKDVFSDYPHTYQTINTTTRFSGIFSGFNRSTSIAILSKYPFESTHNQLIQIDPQVDRWERHAQHVTINLEGELINIFNFHNTFNFNDNDFESEKQGLTRLRDYVISRPGINSVTAGSKTIMLGDFNVLREDVEEILGTPSHAFNGRDHVSSIPLFTQSGVYSTIAADLSDHNAVWAALDLVPPLLDEPQTSTEILSPSSVRVSALASDPNAVQYRFINTNFPNGSHDSPWQVASSYIDTGLAPNTIYTYEVETRDRSVNLNLSDPASISVGPVSDTDLLPDDWERLFFSNLTTSGGTGGEDFDRDGTSDLDEYNAGTDPTDNRSFFRSWLETDETGALVLKWTSADDRSYQIQTSSTLNDNWQTELSGIQATSPVNTEVMDDTSTSKFFRVLVAPSNP